jgi:hypothetical protein
VIGYFRTGVAPRGASHAKEIDMATSELQDPRTGFVQVLLDKVQDDPYPSVTMLDMIESHLAADEVPAYVQQLLDRVREDRFPSMDMLKRIQRFT